ncbi:leucine-rich repeat-containing protein kinase family protein [Comamonas sp.]|uniref:leucine-rich repeat-containing protein kinase family protein n=1 Tax=Comamonas sp. TaxID=34028 RepID=UPI00289B6DD2|nr:leucine-rich repeat-containing protein kinase family protein [Comamonas sp.]
MQSLQALQEQLHSGALRGACQIKLAADLREFPRELFALADTLEMLDLSGNQLSSLPDDLTRFSQLRVLFASNNPFTELPRVLGRMPRLEMVGFKACQIRTVTADSLPPQLRWLILTDNQITELPDTLGERPRLQKLMLACNQLHSLPSGLAHSPRLELLRLAGNRFAALPPEVLAMPALAWLAMAGNPMTLHSEQQVLQANAAAAWRGDDLQRQELLGQGASGHIYRASPAGGGADVALKVFKAGQTSDGTPQSEMAAGLAAGQHPHLLTPLAVLQADVHASSQELAMVLPLLPPGLQPLAGPPSLASCTRDVYADGARFSTAAAQRLLAQVRSAVAHLHGHGMLHGDVYAHNILWNPATGDAMLSDLGAASMLGELPAAQRQQLQQMELRALQHLEAEVQARTH